MSYKSVLVMRPIPDILEKSQGNTSLGISRHLAEDSSSTSSSGSSSDNEISAPLGRRHFGPVPELHLSVLDGSGYSEFPQHAAEAKYPETSLPALKPPKHKAASVKGELGDQLLHEIEEPIAFAQEMEEVGPERKEAQRGHPLEKGAQRPLQTEAGTAEIFRPQEKDTLSIPEEAKMEKTEVGRSPGCVPRHSVIKSTFYSHPSETLANVPSSPGKEHRKHLERAKRTYRKAGYSKALSGLREPLLEQFEFGEEGEGLSVDEETRRGREGGIGPLTKSASFDTAQKSPRVTFEISNRSRSLDDYRIRAASFAEEHYIEEEDSDLVPQGSPKEAAHQLLISEDTVEKTSTKEGAKMAAQVYSQEQAAGLAQQGDRPGSVVAAQKPGKEEGLPEKPKPLLSSKREAAVLGGEGVIPTAEPSDFALAPPKKYVGKERLHDTSKASIVREPVPVPLEGERSQAETAPLISQDSKGARRLPHEAKQASLQSSQRPGLLQVESPDFVKPALVPGTLRSGGLLPQMPSVQGELQKVVTVKGVASGVQQTVPMGGGHSPFQPVIQVGKAPSIPVSQAGTLVLSGLEGKDQKMLPQEQPAVSLTKTAVLEGKGPIGLPISQAKTMPVSIAESESQKLVCQTPGEVKLPIIGPMGTETVLIGGTEGETQRMLQQKPSAYGDIFSGVLKSASAVTEMASRVEPVPISPSAGGGHKVLPPGPSIHSEARSFLSEKKSSPQQAETVQVLTPEGRHPDQLPQKSRVPSERKPEAFEEERHPPRGVARAGPVLAGESQKYEREEYLMPSEVTSAALKGRSQRILTASQAKVSPMSAFGIGDRELLYYMPPEVSEVKSSVLRGQGRLSSAAVSQATVVGFSTSEGERTLMKAPVRRGEQVHQKPSVYTEEEAEALESLVEEMVCLSKEMNVLAESVSDQEGTQRYTSPPREIFYQGPPGQALRPTYLVRKGKREGGIGLADPSEVDVIYPGEEEFFSLSPFMSKKARMAFPYEGRGPDNVGMEMPMASQFTGDQYWYYSGSDRPYDIALVPIQDLWDDMPRPDSKTAKFDISEVEPAFLNLYELYDIVYYPFEFLSFRKAPEKLPGKRRLPSGEKAKLSPSLKAHSPQGKKMRLPEDTLEGDAMREASRVEEAAALESVRPKAARIGKRSDSEGDIPAGSQQGYGLPADPTGKRRSSLQSRLEAFKPFVRSQSMELFEQSLKKRMKASVAHLSRMLSRKPSPDQRSREGNNLFLCLKWLRGRDVSPFLSPQ